MHFIWVTWICVSLLFFGWFGALSFYAFVQKDSDAQATLALSAVISCIVLSLVGPIIGH